MSRAEDTADERPSGRLAAGQVSKEPGAPDAPDASRAADGAGGARSAPGVEPAVGEIADERARIGFIGKRLGRFLITAELGRGGMATVYRARDPQVGRDVAVKVMHGFFAGRAEIEARFRREANAVAAIKHPSILALYDFAPPAGEEPGYIVSELIDGPGLRQLAEDHGGRLWPEVAALIAVRVAEALGTAHQAGIVHRDVKPDNVLIDRAGGGARVVLTDFGVAHVSGMDTMTATGAVLGSPSYMSPEQARGEEVGPASDVFSLGVLMYQLCTGHLPFAGKDPLAVITAILRGEYVRPSKLESRVGPDWEGVITRCLSRAPATRFPDGAAVAQALRRLLTAAGFSDEQAALSRYVADPKVFERAAAPEVAQRALVAAEEARRRRQFPRALAELGRALAYAPEDATARDMLRRLGGGARFLWLRAGVVGAAALALVVAFLLARPARFGPTPFAAGRGGRPPSAITVARETPAVAPPAQPPVGTAAGARALEASGAPEAPAPPTALPAPPPPSEALLHPTAAPPGPTPAGQRRKEVRRARPSPAVRADVLPPAGGEPTRSAAAPVGRDTVPEEPLAPPPPAVVSVRTASVVLRASQAFCEPSLDGHAPSLRASYNDLVPGAHEIYCTLPQGGGKVHVATYDLRPGTRASLTIVRGPDGRPVLGRPQ